MNIFWIITGLIFSYLLGTIPSAYIVTRIISGKDIRGLGSGNVGATNALRAVGKLPAFIVLCADILKGLAAVTVLASFIALKIDMPIELIRALFGFMSVAGHIFNVFLKFKGGKGVATSAGVLLGITPLGLLAGAIVFVVIVTATKYVSAGSIASAVIIPFFLLWTKAHYSYIVLSAVLCIVIVAKHKANINRLMCGRERKAFGKK